MVMKSLTKRDVPWCMLFLVTCTTVCHICVLVGNQQTADSLENIGAATGGWSGVGLDISHALQHELDEIMIDLSNGLLDALNHTLHTSKILNTVTSLAGMAADHIEKASATKAVTLLQEHMVKAGGPLGLLPDLLTSSVNKLLDMLLQKAIDMLDLLMVKIKPVLEAVGRFIIKFGDKIQQVIEGFSITLDRVQKLFDQVMASVSGTGAEVAQMEHETFNLFDVSNTGTVSVSDLQHVATLYSVSAFAGDKAAKMVKKYDKSGDGQLGHPEVNALVHDKTLPTVMSVLLRAYAKRLAEVAGNVAAARQRDEAAQQVVQYLELVTAKNLTKMSWVSQALTNGSLPLQFTACVMGELALSNDDPDKLTTVDVGAVVTGEMMHLNATHVAHAFGLLSNATFWVSNGFHPHDHAEVLRSVTRYMAHPKGIVEHHPPSITGHRALLVTMGGHNETLFLQDSGTPAMVVDDDVVEGMPDIAFRLADRNMKAYIAAEDAAKESMYASMFSTQSSRYMLVRLLGGSLASDGTSSEGERLIKSGRPALPVTLKWLSWLSANATSTAKRFQKLCFNYTKTSSNAVDSFATQIQGMVKKISGFIEMMKRYSTPAGIKQLEKQVESFAVNAAKDVLKLIKKTFGGLVNKSAPLINHAVNHAIDDVGETIGHTIATAVGTPIGQALAPALKSILGGMMGSNGTGPTDKISQELSKIVGTEISQMSGDFLGKELAKLLHMMIDSLLKQAGSVLNKTAHKDIPGLALIEAHFAEHSSFDDVLAMCNEHASRHLALRTFSNASDQAPGKEPDKKMGIALHDTQKATPHFDISTMRRLGGYNGSQHDRATPMSLSVASDGTFLHEDDSEAQLTGIWEEVVTVLRSLSNVMPVATKTLKFARLEVSKLASNLDSLFKPFEKSGPKLFNEFGSMYRMVWIIWFCFMVPLTLALVFYGFWAGGFFGGPGNHWIEEDPEDNTPEEEKGFTYKCGLCCEACCHCLHGFHDLGISFWSFLILMQLIVVLIFIMALVLMILAGVKAFVSAGCEQIYILGDPTICGQTLGSLRDFLNTFLERFTAARLPDFCHEHDLLVCKAIETELMSSAILTSVCGFLSGMFSFQLLVESATLHTRAVWRRKAVREFNRPDDDDDDKPEGDKPETPKDR